MSNILDPYIFSKHKTNTYLTKNSDKLMLPHKLATEILKPPGVFERDEILLDL